MAQRFLFTSRSTAPLLERAAEFLNEHSSRSETLLLAPTRAAARELILTGLPDGSEGVHALTLTQLATHLATREMGRRGLAPISRLGIDALVARVADSAARSKKLTYFAPVAATPGFSRAVARTILELRLEAIANHDLKAGGAPGADLAYLAAQYEKELAARSLADLPLLLALATEGAAADSRYCGLPLLLLHADLESPSHARLVAAMIARSPAVLATATTGDDRSLVQLAGLLEVQPRDLDTDEPAGAPLDRVRRWLFSNEQPPEAPVAPDLLFSSPGEGLECVEIARRIRALAASGLPFDRVAILLRNVEQYQPLVEEALRRAAIPGYFSRGVARPDPAGRAFLALLACASEGCSASRFAEYLSLSQVPPLEDDGTPKPPPDVWVPPDDEILASAPEPAPEVPESEGITEDSRLAVPVGWEQLMVDAAVIGGHGRWARRLRGLRAELDAQLKNLDRDDQAHRPRIENRIRQLERLKQFSLPLIDRLGSLPDATNWSHWLERLTELARSALRRPQSVLAVLSELQPMGQVGPVTLDEVYDVLDGKLALLRVEPPKRRYGHVFVGSIDEARGRVFDAVFLPGLAEGLFPRRAWEDPILLDAHRDTISKSLARQDQRVAQERMLLRAAAAAARSTFTVSYPSMDLIQARPRVPSFYALEVVRAAEGRLPSLRELEKRAEKGAPARLNWPAPREPEQSIDDAEYDLASLRAARGKGSARYLMEVNPSLARSFRARWMRWHNKWSTADGLVDPGAPAREILAGHLLSRRAYSPSSLQQFAACPYRFLLYGIFQFREREAPAPLEQMDPLTRGALFHAVQFELFGELDRAGRLPVTLVTLATALNLADQVLDRVAARFEEDLAPAIPRVWRTEVEDLRTDLRGWLQQIARFKSDWTPVHFEFAFGLTKDPHRDPASVADEAVVANGMRLRGSIDLIEKHATRNVLRVVDHKTGKPPDRSPHSVGGGSVLQPLLYSLAAEKLLASPIESGSLFYCTQRGNFSEIEIPVNADSRNRLARVLTAIDNAIEDGFFPAAPQSGACTHCDYTAVCGPYEEQRAGRKRGDRLDPLVEIRNLP